MTDNKLNERLFDLRNVLTYDSLSGGYFTVGQRICINQECGAIFDQLNVLNGSLPEPLARTYKVPAAIEAKIQFILKKYS